MMLEKTRSRSKAKKGPARSRSHMGRVAELPCVICSAPAEVHHVDILTPKGMGPKVSDYLTVPLCPKHHRLNTYDSAHGANGEKAFWDLHHFPVGYYIVQLLRAMYGMDSPDADEAIAAIERNHAYPLNAHRSLYREQ